jgi:hypothetical protein
VPAGPSDARRGVSVVTTVTSAGPGAARQVTTALDVPPGWTAQAAGPASTSQSAGEQGLDTFGGFAVTP